MNELIEWLELVIEAKRLGLTVEQVREFLKTTIENGGIDK